ncbi:MAG: VIT domain-containing protein [Candidatus Electrothrix sp. GW3-4]|uniref:VIT domain-containing protein n=1 Tax=Candidatus Electrothrix sp. GW3-4 TaxID=3126740 RepID=UPI0030CCF5E0
MKRINQLVANVLLYCLFPLLGAGSAQAAGLLTPSDHSLPALEIKDHRVQVVIEDGYAITTVEQVFHNPHAQDLEAMYSFPVPEKAAVAEFTLWIDNKPVHGEVLEKDKARTIYEEQKAAGEDAGLTEKDSYKTFDIMVSPVRAGQDTRIRIGYIQPVKVDSSMGRYVYPLEEGGVDDAKLSFWTANEKVTHTFRFDLILRPGYPVDGIRLPNHPTATIEHKGDSYHVHLGNSSGPPLQRRSLIRKTGKETRQRARKLDRRLPRQQACNNRVQPLLWTGILWSTIATRKTCPVQSTWSPISRNRERQVPLCSRSLRPWISNPSPRAGTGFLSWIFRDP